MASLFEKIRYKNHLYVFYDGELIYKQWLDKNGKKTEPSMIFDRFQNFKIISNVESESMDEGTDDDRRRG